jgi:hypothetical protein
MAWNVEHGINSIKTKEYISFQDDTEGKLFDH